MVGPSESKVALARDAWSAMFDFLVRTAPQRVGSLGRRGLTPNDSRALWSLDPKRGRPMRVLADEWQCDASNATWIVDRLEELGLAQRQASLNDRRVKLVLLTVKGAKLKAELDNEFHAPPPELLGLDRADLEDLSRVLRKLQS